VDLAHPKVPPDVLVVRIPRVAAAPVAHHLLVPAEVAMTTIAVGAGPVSMVTKRAMPTSTALGIGTAHIMSPPPLPNATGDICAWVKTTAFVRGIGTVVMPLALARVNSSL